MRDGLRFSVRVVAELGRIGRGRLRLPSAQVPRNLDSVDSAWLERALSDERSSPRISRLDALSDSSGTTDRRRLAVHYVKGRAEHGAPASVFLKAPPRSFAALLFGNLFSLGSNEVSFYRHLRRELPIPAPSCFAARESEDGRFILVLEDLEAAGAAFPTIVDQVTVAQAEAVARMLATLHGTYWGPDIARRLPWLRTPARSDRAAVERFVGASAHGPTMKRFPELLPEAVRRGAKRIHVERRALERYWASGPLTLIHGDPHIGNVYFIGERAGLLDWQVVQHHQGVRDLAYFLILSLETELRREHEERIFRLYLERLRECAIPNRLSDSNRLWDLYRSFSLYAYIGTSVTTSMSNLQPEPIARKGLERAASAVDDLDALSLLDGLS